MPYYYAFSAIFISIIIIKYSLKLSSINKTSIISLKKSPLLNCTLFLIAYTPKNNKKILDPSYDVYLGSFEISYLLIYILLLKIVLLFHASLIFTMFIIKFYFFNTSVTKLIYYFKKLYKDHYKCMIYFFD